MAKSMMARAIRGGVKVDFLLADAWFGTKAMLRSTEELSLTAIVRMKKSSTSVFPRTNSNRTFHHCSGSLSELLRFSWTSRILH
jgi:hypothetical protein